jgi:hypothetical protein
MPNKHVAAQPQQAKPDLVVTLAVDQFGSWPFSGWKSNRSVGLQDQ